MKQARDSVGSGDVIAQIDTEAKASATAAAAPQPSTKPVAAAPAQPAAKTQPAVMPAAQKIAAEKGIDTSNVPGTGRDGRVTKGDVLQQAAAPTPAAKAPLPQPAPPANLDQLLSGRPEQRVPMSRLRQRVAERLVQSHAAAAALSTLHQADIAPQIEMRERYHE